VKVPGPQLETKNINSEYNINWAVNEALEATYIYSQGFNFNENGSSLCCKFLPIRTNVTCG
jgi:hypothetical protein